MILRRFSEALARQDWTVVLIELLVVVVGIFLGMQVDDWNQARQDRKDEQVFLGRLHQDVLLARELSDRVRDRRLNRLQSIMLAADVLFQRAGRDVLTEEECIAVVSSNFYNVNIASLTSLSELEGAGRLQILRNPELRTALVELQQRSDALVQLINLQSNRATFTHLPSSFPELMQLTAYYDAELDEIRAAPVCDLEGMRKNQMFLNRFSVNADGYDAYIRDGLAPWHAQFEHVHTLLDQALGITHPGTEGS